MVRVSDWYELRDPQMVTTYCIHVTLFWCLPPLTANLIIPPISYFAHHLLPFSPLSASNFWICVTHCVGISDLAPSDVKCSYLEEKNSIFKFSFDGKASCRYSVLWYMGVSTSNIFFLCHPHSPRGGGHLVWNWQQVRPKIGGQKNGPYSDWQRYEKDTLTVICIWILNNDNSVWQIDARGDKSP